MSPSWLWNDRRGGGKPALPEISQMVSENRDDVMNSILSEIIEWLVAAGEIGTFPDAHNINWPERNQCGNRLALNSFRIFFFFLSSRLASVQYLFVVILTPSRIFGEEVASSYLAEFLISSIFSIPKFISINWITAYSKLLYWIDDDLNYSFLVLKTGGQCRDQSNYCGLVETLELCYIPRYKQHCCHTCHHFGRVKKPKTVNLHSHLEKKKKKKTTNHKKRKNPARSTIETHFNQTQSWNNNNRKYSQSQQAF